jgi:hypothetical protein
MAKLKPYNHSFDARKAVCELAIARLEEKASKRLMMIEKCEMKCNKTGSTKTVKFSDKPLDKKGKVTSINSVKKLYPLADLRSIGRHYVIKSTSHPHVIDPSGVGEFEDKKYGIRRHYTEAFCMRRDIYDNLIRLSKKHSLEEGARAAYEISWAIKKANEDSICLTLKDYKIEYGLSNFISKDIDSGQNLY